MLNLNLWLLPCAEVGSSFLVTKPACKFFITSVEKLIIFIVDNNYTMEPLQEMQRLLSSSTKTDLTSLLNTHIETICYFIKTEEKASKIIVSYLNNLLNIPTKRDNTLLLLSKLLPHMPPSIVKENAPTWYTITVNSDQCNLIKFGILRESLTLYILYFYY